MKPSEEEELGNDLSEALYTEANKSARMNESNRIIIIHLRYSNRINQSSIIDVLFVSHGTISNDMT